jgi:predicted RNA-binding Zn ribbon-like protein
MSELAPERPLRGEPLGLDLLNTVWHRGDGQADLFDHPDGVRSWLTDNGLDLSSAHAALEAPDLLEATRDALVTARSAIRAHADDPTSPTARAALNEVLAWGRSWPMLTEHGVTNALDVPNPAHRPGWLAALNYAELFAADPRRIRRCAHPSCILYFHDTSPKRARRWCSMATCGNRAKAARHYARSRGS